MKATFLSCGDTALAVQFGMDIDRALNNKIVALCRLLQAAAMPGIVEMVPSYRSFLIHYDPLVTSRAALEEQIAPFLERELSETVAGGNEWRIPVCFDEDFASDLGDVSIATGLSRTEIIDHFTRTEHHVYMLGFAPGQPYMGDLPKALSIPRRERPVPRIERGSVVTATGLTVIYPAANPTGWHVVGRTPISVFDAARDVPVLLKPGDKVRLTQVERADFDALEAEIRDGAFDVSELLAS